MYDGFDWKPYVPVAERRRKAMQKMEKLRKQGRTISPVTIEGRTIARTFWGKAWCENLESYSDYENRIPRGRTYVRNGSVVDLQISPGLITAMVSGSEIYKIEVKIQPVAKSVWEAICTDCSGSIASLVELLQGRLSKSVMERISQQRTGLFPSPTEIKLGCSCPDWAEMCKHVAAVLYGIGARLDQQPELLFRLRQVDEKQLIAKADSAMPRAVKRPSKALGGEDLSKLFGLDLAVPVAKAEQKKIAPQKAKSVAKKSASSAKTATKTAPAKKTATRTTTSKAKAAPVPTPAPTLTSRKGKSTKLKSPVEQPVKTAKASARSAKSVVSVKSVL